MKKQVLGVKIDDVNIDQALKMVEGWLNGYGKHYITTPNPEIVMMAQKDKELKKILNNADLAIPDGAGLKLTGDIVCHTPGIDFMEALIKKASEKGLTTGFLGGRGQVAQKTSDCLTKLYPKLKITFAESGGEVDEEGNSIGYKVESIEGKTKKTKPLNTLYPIPNTDLLFVAFGPPKQEKWIAKNLPKLPVRIAMGVGGSFDYLSGKVPRTPKWLRNLDLEWLFRLVLQPWRIKRQLSLIKYLLMVL